MSRAVLASIDELTMHNQSISSDIAIDQGSTIASSILQVHPRLLQNSTLRETRAFWRLTGYNPSIPNEADPEPLLNTLEILQHAEHIPGDIITQMRHYRDSSSTMYHDPRLDSVTVIGEDMNVEMSELNERERELTEATVRAVLGTFVAQYTGDNADRTFAVAALEDFSARALTDVTGMVHALSLISILGSIGVTQKPWGQATLAPLRQKIVNFAPRVELTNISPEELATFTESVNAFIQEFPSSEASGLLDRLYARLEEHELLYTIGDPHLTEQTSSLSRQRMAEVSRATTAKRLVDSALSLLRNNVDTPPTADAVIRDFETVGFSPELVLRAFGLVAAELDQTKRDALSARFDAAINAALQKLSPEHKLTGPDALTELGGGIDYNALSHFPSGQRFLDKCIRSLSKTSSSHLHRPDEWLNQQTYPDFVIAQKLARIHDALWYNRDYYRVKTPQKTETLTTVAKMFKSALNFMNGRTIQPGTQMILSKSGAGVLAFLEEASAEGDSSNQANTTADAAQASIDAPLDKLLAYYHQPRAKA